MPMPYSRLRNLQIDHFRKLGLIKVKELFLSMELIRFFFRNKVQQQLSKMKHVID